jgi:hypothetical protein
MSILGEVPTAILPTRRVEKSSPEFAGCEETARFGEFDRKRRQR